VPRRGKRLQQEHPEVRHEITRNPIVGVIKQDPHSLFFVPTCV